MVSSFVSSLKWSHGQSVLPPRGCSYSWIIAVLFFFFSNNYKNAHVWKKSSNFDQLVNWESAQKQLKWAVMWHVMQRKCIPAGLYRRLSDGAAKRFKRDLNSVTSVRKRTRPLQKVSFCIHRITCVCSPGCRLEPTRESCSVVFYNPVYFATIGLNKRLHSNHNAHANSSASFIRM